VLRSLRETALSQNERLGGLLGMNLLQSTVTSAGKAPSAAPRVREMKRDAVIYWTTTGIVCAVMLFSAVNFNLAEPIGPMKGAFTHLGFPDYFKIELTVAKTLGVLALLLPNLPSKMKEFAYAGFTITLISASIAHFSSGDSVMFVIDPLIFLSLLIVSYSYFNRRRSGSDTAKAG
jgi:DoxX-like family